MDYERLIKKEFCFLLKYGFIRKNYTRNFEVEIYFVKDSLSIGINYVSYNNSIVGCGIEKKHIKENILQSNMFSYDQLIELNNLISTNIDDAEEQIKIYAKFISENIGQILNN